MRGLWAFFLCCGDVSVVSGQCVTLRGVQRRGRGAGHGGVALVPEYSGGRRRGRGRGVPGGRGGRVPGEGAPALQVYRATSPHGAAHGQRGRESVY